MILLNIKLYFILSVFEQNNVEVNKRASIPILIKWTRKKYTSAHEQ